MPAHGGHGQGLEMGAGRGRGNGAFQLSSGCPHAQTGPHPLDTLLRGWDWRAVPCRPQGPLTLSVQALQ